MGTHQEAAVYTCCSTRGNSSRILIYYSEYICIFLLLESSGPWWRTRWVQPLGCCCVHNTWKCPSMSCFSCLTACAFASEEAAQSRWFFFFLFLFHTTRWFYIFISEQEKAARKQQPFFIMRALQPNIIPMKEPDSLFFLHECSYFVGESDKKKNKKGK